MLWIRSNQPEVGEVRKLLAALTGCVDGEPAGGHSVKLVAAEHPEIRRAQKHQQLVLIGRGVQRVVNPKTGEPQIAIGLGRRVVAEGEIIRAVGNLGPLTVGDFVDVNARLVEESAVKELNLEWQFFAAPQRALRQETDLPVMIVIKIFQVVR